MTGSRLLHAVSLGTPWQGCSPDFRGRCRNPGPATELGERRPPDASGGSSGTHPPGASLLLKSGVDSGTGHVRAATLGFFSGVGGDDEMRRAANKSGQSCVTSPWLLSPWLSQRLPSRWLHC